jgi:hypothetical protein
LLYFLEFLTSKNFYSKFSAQLRKFSPNDLHQLILSFVRELQIVRPNFILPKGLIILTSSRRLFWGHHFLLRVNQDQFIRLLESISPTFYMQLFCTNISQESFRTTYILGLCLIGAIILAQKVLKKCWWNWHLLSSSSFSLEMMRMTFIRVKVRWRRLESKSVNGYVILRIFWLFLFHKFTFYAFQNKFDILHKS